MDLLVPDHEIERIEKQLSEAIRVIYATHQAVIDLRRDMAWQWLDSVYNDAARRFKGLGKRRNIPFEDDLTGDVFDNIQGDYRSTAHDWAPHLKIDPRRLYADLFAPIVKLVDGYYNVFRKVFHEKEEPFRDHALQLQRVLKFIDAADAGPNPWLLEGFVGNPDPKGGVDLFMTRYGRLEGLWPYVRPTHLAVVRYEHDPNVVVDVDKAVARINEGIKQVCEWFSYESCKLRPFFPPGSQKIVALIFEAEIPVEKAKKIADGVKLEKDELVLIIWRGRRGDKITTNVVAVNSIRRAYSEEEIKELTTSLTPWDDTFADVVIEEAMYKLPVFLIGGVVNPIMVITPESPICADLIEDQRREQRELLV